MAGGRFSVEAVFKAIDRFTRPVSRMQRRMTRFSHSASRGLRAVDHVASNLSSRLSTIGRTAAGVATTVAVAGGTAAAVIGKTGADFEQAITNVGAVGLQTRSQIADLEAMALKLGATTKFTGTQAAEGMEILRRAGFASHEVLAGIPGVLYASAASGLEMAEVADHVSNALKGMGLEANQATRVADVLALASSRTNSTIGTLGESLRNVASTARELKIPFEDVVAGVAALQDVGLDASVAGSAMNTMLTKLAAPSASLKRKMAELGIAFADAKGNALPFMDILANLAKGGAKAGGNMDRVAFLAELVGLRGQKAASNLATLFETGKLQKLTAELKNAEGAAQKMASIRMQTLKGDITLLGSAIDAVQVALFNTESGPLRGVVQGMTRWVNANKALIVSGFTDYMQRTRANLPEIVTWLKRIAIGVGIFLALTVAVKAVQVAVAAAELALLAYRGAMLVTTGAGKALTLTSKGVAAATLWVRNSTVTATAATWASTIAHRAKNIALAFGQIATTRFTAATIASTAAGWINVAATWAKQAAQAAHNVVVGLGGKLTKMFTVATAASTGATVANTAATWARTAALGAKTAALRVSTAVTGLWSTATGTATATTVGATVAVKALVVTLGAAAAAVGALMLAWDQWSKLKKEAGGWEGIKSGWNSMLEGKGLFAGVDEEMNRQARAEAKQREQRQAGRQMVSPQARVAHTISETRATTTTNAEVTIRDETGRAKVTRAPKGNVGLRVQPSGAF